MNQLELFDLPYQLQRDCAAQVARLSRQCRAIYDALLSGPRTNVELARLALKYSGRISDLRKTLRPAGYDIECVDHDHKTGVCRYRLVSICPPCQRGEWRSSSKCPH